MAGIDSLAVWVGNVHAGLLKREHRHEYVFAYAPDAPRSTQVSLTMPVRLASWQSTVLHPIFQMNLPEGALLEAIRRMISKAGAVSRTYWAPCPPFGHLRHPTEGDA